MLANSFIETQTTPYVIAPAAASRRITLRMSISYQSISSLNERIKMMRLPMGRNGPQTKSPSRADTRPIPERMEWYCKASLKWSKKSPAVVDPSLSSHMAIAIPNALVTTDIAMITRKIMIRLKDKVNIIVRRSFNR